MVNWDWLMHLPSGGQFCKNGPIFNNFIINKKCTLTFPMIASRIIVQLTTEHMEHQHHYQCTMVLSRTFVCPKTWFISKHISCKYCLSVFILSSRMHKIFERGLPNTTFCIHSAMSNLSEENYNSKYLLDFLTSWIC